MYFYRFLWPLYLFVMVVMPLYAAENPAPPKASGAVVVHEHYTDVPWQQKLGTFLSNAFVIPFAIPASAITADCSDSPGRCILRYGIVNVIGIERTDTVYTPNETRFCQSGHCVEVVVTVGNYNTMTSGKPEPDVFGVPVAVPPYKGYVINIGTTYGPQLPWYLSHYCSSGTGVQDQLPDNVCYADYFTDLVDGFRLTPYPEGAFPKERPWYVFDHNPDNLCQAGQTLCSIQMGAFDMQILSEPPLFADKNNAVIETFNQQLAGFSDDGTHFPWSKVPQISFASLLTYSQKNPFVGHYETVYYRDQEQTGMKLYGPKQFLYPSLCQLSDLENNNSEQLRKCGINYEIHHSGFKFKADGSEQWPGSQNLVYINSYSRTAFMYAGIPAEAMPVPVSLRDRIERASIFTTYMPLVNAGDFQSPSNRPYNKDYWHTLYLTNHRIMDVLTFISGVRGKILFHNEYRSKKLFPPEGDIAAPPENFPASVHYNGPSNRYSAVSCDACHIRNGSGIPLKFRNVQSTELVATDQQGIDYPYHLERDYTLTQPPAPMGLRFIDLGANHPAQTTMDSEYLYNNSPRVSQGYYSNRIMNFYGKMFYVFGSQRDGRFRWTLHNIAELPSHVQYSIVDDTKRGAYVPKQIVFAPFIAAENCQPSDIKTMPTGVPGLSPNIWPQQCSDVNGAAIDQALASADLGVMLLNANRLVGMNVLEALPNQWILKNQARQAREFGPEIAGSVSWVPGSYQLANKRSIRWCAENEKNLHTCFIGRFGWSAATGTLEDQVSGGAGYPELNLTAVSERVDGKKIPFRFTAPNCGPANTRCLESQPNSVLTEEEIGNLADYMRWLGVFNRSEFQVASDIVQRGERVFKQLGCNHCHIVDKIALDPQDNVLPEEYRTRLQSLSDDTHQPFVSYLGSDLLLHDMGYLSQVAPTPEGHAIRDKNGVILPQYKTYIYKFRTPPLMNLRFNRFVTDSRFYLADGSAVGKNCDFLLHDGRACDVIEASLLHDGPLVKKLNMITQLNRLSQADRDALRAFLYSL
ncbi:MAG: hypothetical protein JJT82_05995 [Legionellaceae bacterium]|nr:hypothetical protein [Legionellaceae bacterium]